VTRVLVVWEDTYCESLGALVKRAVHAHGAPTAAARPTVVRHTSRGNAKFSATFETRGRWRARVGPLDARPIDDAVSALARESLPLSLARVPDLAHLASMIWTLHRGVPEPARAEDS
jgi:hypothetical protein